MTPFYWSRWGWFAWLRFDIGEFGLGVQVTPGGLVRAGTDERVMGGHVTVWLGWFTGRIGAE